MSIRDLWRALCLPEKQKPVPPFPVGVQRLPVEPWALRLILLPDDPSPVLRTETWRTEHDSLEFGYYERTTEVRIVASDLEMAATEYLRYLALFPGTVDT